jgi:DNA mismatch repair protein MutS
MQQYLRIKGEHPDEILLFRLGDFYETFFDDAKITARALDIALTSRNAGDGEDAIPLAGFPVHSREVYISRLLKAGHRVAVCEQVEDPKLAKGLVRREVVEVLTTGTALSEGFLEDSRNNYLMVVSSAEDGLGVWGLAIADVSTGELEVIEVPSSGFPDEIQRYMPSEIVAPDHLNIDPFVEIPGTGVQTVTRLEGYHFSRDLAEQTLKEHFGVETLKGFGLDEMDHAVRALGALLSYLQEKRLASLGHLMRVRIRDSGEGMLLDAATQRNLELVANIRDGGRSGTLLDIVDYSRTAMGARALRSALLRPLKTASAIDARLDAVAELIEEPDLRDAAAEALEGLGDLERLAVRVETGKATPRDLSALCRIQASIPVLKDVLSSFPSSLLVEMGESLDSLEALTHGLRAALEESSPLSLTEGGIIRDGYSDELDRLRDLMSSGKGWIAQLQQSERERTGIPTLKIGYNKVFGYYLEVTRTHVEKVPDDYIRKQTLVAAERYVTPELKEKEEEVLKAEERANGLEYQLFTDLRQEAAEHLQVLQSNASALATVDMLTSLAEAAVRHNFVRPELTDDGTLEIEDGRHPVVEALLPQATFIPNDTLLSEERQIAIVTGPNMSGKSTYLRQVGLICLLAQAGSFVPAARARLPVLDRIFTRVGAMDNLAGGESTFLVEMHETANILHNATTDSLVLLDEVGRGTSTYDGLSIAWAVGEYLHEEVGAETIFATHYHELTVLAERFARVFNLNVAVKEWGDKVIFLHKIVPGGCDHSYGIHVAELAGVPGPVITRARDILRNLEEERPLPEGETAGPVSANKQTELFSGRPDPLIKELRKVDPDNLTPVEALNLLVKLTKMIGTE